MTEPKSASQLNANSTIEAAWKFFEIAVKAEAAGEPSKMRMALTQACKIELRALGYTEQAERLEPVK